MVCCVARTVSSIRWEPCMVDSVLEETSALQEKRLRQVRFWFLRALS